MCDWEKNRGEGKAEPVRAAHWELREKSGWSKLAGVVDSWVLVEDATGAWLRWSVEPKENGQPANRDELAGVR